MSKTVLTYLKKINAKALAMVLASVILCSWTSVNAAYDWSTGNYVAEEKPKCEDSGTCTAYKAGSKFAVKCPGGGSEKRYDISSTCLQNMNASDSNCINTMPVEKVERVPEDVCYRYSWGQNHEGMDYASATGNAVFAAADGIVHEVNYCSSGYGLKIVIYHEKADGGQRTNFVETSPKNYYTTLYAHLSEIMVTQGQKVKKNQQIGRVGQTNCSGVQGAKAWVEPKYGQHLHFEIRDGANAKGTVIDPMCDNIQSICGVCSDKFKASECRTDCRKNPNEPHCQPTGYAKFNYSATASGQQNINYSDSFSVVPSTAYSQRSLGNKECNISSYRESFTTCIFCDLFRVLFDVASIIAAKAYAALAAAVTNVVIIGMALWLAFTIIKFIASMEVKDPRIMVKTILNQAFVVLIVIVLLKYDLKELMNIALTPIFNTGMQLAQLVTSGGTEQACEGFTKVTTEGGIPESIGNNILCTIMSIQGKILDIMTLGSTSLCVGFFVQSWKGWFIFPHLGYVIVGLLLWIAAFLLLVIYPFLLVDSILQLSVATALLPAAIGTYAFQITRKKYLSKVWETFMNAMFTFVFLSIVIFIITTGIDSIVGQTLSTNLRNVGTGDNSYSLILDVVNGLAWWGVKFLQLIFMMLLGWAVLDEAKSFAGSFTKGGFKFSENIGSNVGTTAMSGVQGVAAPAAKGAFHLASKGGKAVTNTVKGKLHAAKVSHQANKIKNNKNAVVNQNGGLTLTTRNWRGQKVTKTLTTGANGNQLITKTKGKVTTQTDKFMTVTTKKDKKGNVVNQSVKMQAASAKTLLNNDGSLNMVAINAIRQNSQHAPNDINMAIMNQVLKERMPGVDIANMDNTFTSRQIVSSNGNNFEIKQVNTDGTTTSFKMDMNGDRVMTSVEHVDKNGKAKLYQSDGIINKKSSYNYVNGQINQKSVKDKYAFNSYYTKFGGAPMDSNGNFSNGVNRSDVMFGQDDLDLMKAQIGVYGQPASFSEFK